MEENKRFRNHISIIVEQTGGILIALLIILVPQLLENIRDITDITEAGIQLLSGKGMLVNLGILLVLFVIVGWQVLVWARTYISIQENAIVIDRETLNRKKDTIGIRNISNINMEQNLFEMLIGTCKLKLDTNSRSTADSTDVKIVLKKEAALRFKQEIEGRMREIYRERWDRARATATSEERKALLYGQFHDHGTVPASSEEAAGYFGEMQAEGMQAGEILAGEMQEEEFDIRADFGEILQHGLFSINIISLVILILGVAGTVTTVISILNEPDLMQSVLGAASGIIAAVVVVFSALWDTVKDFVRYYDFRTKRAGDKLHIKYGLFKKIEYTIPVDKIQALKIRQSFIARIGKRYMAEIVNVGMGDDQSEKDSFLILYGTEERLKERLHILLPEFSGAAELKTERLPASVWAAWVVPGAVYTLCVIAPTVAAYVLFNREYTMWVLIAAAVLELFLLLGMVLKYRTDGTGAGKEFLKVSRGYFGRNYLAVRYQNIQYVKFSQNPVARAFGLKKGEAHLLAASMNSTHAIPYFKNDVDEKIKKGMLAYPKRVI